MSSTTRILMNGANGKSVHNKDNDSVLQSPEVSIPALKKRELTVSELDGGCRKIDNGTRARGRHMKRRLKQPSKDKVDMRLKKVKAALKQRAWNTCGRINRLICSAAVSGVKMASVKAFIAGKYIYTVSKPKMAKIAPKAAHLSYQMVKYGSKCMANGVLYAGNKMISRVNNHSNSLDAKVRLLEERLALVEKQLCLTSSTKTLPLETEADSSIQPKLRSTNQPLHNLSSRTISSNNSNESDLIELKKYSRMVAVGVPEQAVVNSMRQDNVDPSLLFPELDNPKEQEKEQLANPQETHESVNSENINLMNLPATKFKAADLQKVKLRSTQQRSPKKPLPQKCGFSLKELEEAKSKLAAVKKTTKRADLKSPSQAKSNGEFLELALKRKFATVAVSPNSVAPSPMVSEGWQTVRKTRRPKC